jgi:predicted cobalt transporter CbtA
MRGDIGATEGAFPASHLAIFASNLVSRLSFAMALIVELRGLVEYEVGPTQQLDSGRGMGVGGWPRFHIVPTLQLASPHPVPDAETDALSEEDVFRMAYIFCQDD